MAWDTVLVINVATMSRHVFFFLTPDFDVFRLSQPIGVRVLVEKVAIFLTSTVLSMSEYILPYRFYSGTTVAPSPASSTSRPFLVTD